MHVPYQGGALAVTDLLASPVRVYFDGIAASLSSDYRLGDARNVETIKVIEDWQPVAVMAALSER